MFQFWEGGPEREGDDGSVIISFLSWSPSLVDCGKLGEWVKFTLARIGDVDSTCTTLQNQINQVCGDNDLWLRGRTQLYEGSKSCGMHAEWTTPFSREKGS
jgi:hypothetical protein